MSPDPCAPTVFWIADAPNIQYVKAPMALHVSYWHNNGVTRPTLPPGWNAVRPSKLTGPASRIVIRPL